MVKFYMKKNQITEPLEPDFWTDVLMYLRTQI